MHEEPEQISSQNFPNFNDSHITPFM